LIPIVEECNRGGADSLALDELVVLVGKVAEWTRRLARRREASVAEEVYLTREEVLELRLCFADHTKTGALGPPEMRKLLKEINPAVLPTQGELESLIQECGPDADFRRQESMLPVEPLLTDGGSLTIDMSERKDELRTKVLLFEGYLRFMANLAEED